MITFLSILAGTAGFTLVMARLVTSSTYAKYKKQQAAYSAMPAEERISVRAPSEPAAAAMFNSGPAKTTGTLLLSSALVIGIVNSMFFYAEPGYNYHVKTIWGTEDVVTDIGWAVSGFKTPEPWKKESSIVLTNEVGNNGDSMNVTSIQPAYRSRLLDNVSAEIDATVRFRIPSDKEGFLKMARAYRTQENLVNTSLLPAVKQTLNATSSLMGAEEYYSGGRTEFSNEFERQMNNGIYDVKRFERTIVTEQSQLASSNPDRSDKQKSADSEEQTKTVYVVEKKLDPKTGLPVVNPHNFSDFAVQIVSAVVTDLEPNDAFIKRMALKQNASADRAIAKEQRMQEQEGRLLAEARGQREVAQEKAAALKTQIKLTTDAETEKQLAITKANQIKESAAIKEATATINLRTADLEAQAVVLTADADAHAKKVVMKANGALELKLAAYKSVQAEWANAYAQRKVPQMVFAGGSGANMAGGNADATMFQSMLNAGLAKDLMLDMSMNGK